MSILTVHRPLSFWTLLQSRVQAELTSQRARVRAATVPVTVTVDSAATSEARVAQAKAVLTSALQRLDALQLLALTLRSQLGGVRHQIGAVFLESRLEHLQDVLNGTAALIADRPSRAAAKQTLAQLQASFASASKPGGGEWAAVERGRVLGQSVELPVFSAEDAAGYDAYVQQVSNEIADLHSELDALQSSTVLALRISPDITGILGELGVAHVVETPPPAPALDAPAPADAQA